MRYRYWEAGRSRQVRGRWSRGVKYGKGGRVEGSWSVTQVGERCRETDRYRTGVGEAERVNGGRYEEGGGVHK